jgi:hypothetical protein
MKLTPEVTAKIENFAAVLERQQIQGLNASGLACEANLANARTSIKPGRKYVNVDIGNSGRFMVDIDSGYIYGIKAYGQIHKGHFYGHLDTIHEWNWSGYYPVKLPMSQICPSGLKKLQNTSFEAPKLVSPLGQRSVTMIVAIHVKLDESVDPESLTLEMDHARCFPKSGTRVVGHVVAHETESVSYE